MEKIDQAMEVYEEFHAAIEALSGPDSPCTQKIGTVYAGMLADLADRRVEKVQAEVLLKEYTRRITAECLRNCWMRCRR